MITDTIEVINLVITTLLALVAFFGGTVIRGLSDAVRELRDVDAKLSEMINERVRVDDYRDFRAEMREQFALISNKLDAITQAMASKVSRDELRL